jgi:spermidine synthase
VVLGALLIATSLLGRTGAGLFGRVIHRKDSLYHRIYVYESGSIRTLRFACRDPYVIQSQVDLSDPRRMMSEYTQLALGGLLYVPEPRRALVVGLGGGVIPREMHHYLKEVEIDIAEIDPDIPPIAERHFGFSVSERMRVHVADGRVFIKKQLRQEPMQRYDIVVLDAYVGEYIPFHLMTREFLEQVKAVLTENGVVVANVLGTNRLLHAELRTFQEVFEHCQAIIGRHSTNTMLVGFGAAVQPLTSAEALERASVLQDKHRFAFDIRRVARRLVTAPQPGSWARVLTDDQAPVNYLRWMEEQEPIGEPPPVRGDPERAVREDDGAEDDLSQSDPSSGNEGPP